MVLVVGSSGGSPDVGGTAGIVLVGMVVRSTALVDVEASLAVVHAVIVMRTSSHRPDMYRSYLRRSATFL
jgi:hypothetical protein